MPLIVLPLIADSRPEAEKQMRQRLPRGNHVRWGTRGNPNAHGGPFPRIVQIRIVPAKQLQDTGCDIDRKKKYAPALVLFNVNMLVYTNAPQYSVIDTDYHVAKGNRDKPGARRKKRNDSIQVTAGDFNHAVPEANCRAHEQCSGGEQQPDRRCRERPRITYRLRHQRPDDWRIRLTRRNRAAIPGM